MAKKILVTGATSSHVGFQIIKNLIEKQEDIFIVALDNDKDLLFSSKNALNQPLLISEKIEWLKVDLCNESMLEPFFIQTDEVYHCFDLTDADEKQAQLLYEYNTLLTQRLVNLSLKHGIKKMVYLSSAMIMQNDTFDENRLIIEEEQELPSDMGYYIKSKLWAEMEVKRGMHEGLTTSIVNPTFILAPEHKNTFIHQMVKKGVYPSGSYGFVDIRDVASAMIMLMANAKANNKSFILNAENISYREIVERIAEKVGRKKSFRPMNEHRSPSIWNWMKSKTTSQTQTPFLDDRLHQHRRYDGTKIKTIDKHFRYIPIQESLDYVYAHPKS